ncbi:MAG: DUF1080 domain-containing protein, partial [Gemmataceae bacterium]|nr:DUF1080 domain-containing protein [Gemmataceae bacterium]
MRWRSVRSLLGVLGLMVWSLWSAPAAEPAKGPSALEADPSGWIDLLPGRDLNGWRRVVLPPDEKLNSKNPWSVDPERRLLLCDGVGVKEMLLHEHERGDGVFHVEWRFRPVPDKSGYNGGVYVRSALDGKSWFQAQVAHLMQPPRLGDLFFERTVNGKPERVVIAGKGHELGKPLGEWNSYEVTCKGKEITVWINGAVATTWNECPVPRGHVGLQ